MNHTFIVFIDSFAAYYLDEFPMETSFLRSLPFHKHVIPGLGYSINQKAELFGGYNPDDLGYFCKWGYSPESRFRKWGSALALLKPLTYQDFVDRTSHRVLSKLLGVDLFTIPYDKIRYFDLFGHYEVYDDRFPHKTVFSKGNVTKLLDNQVPRGSDPDEYLFEEAMSALRVGGFQHLFVTFNDLDRISHRYGVGSESHRTKLRWLDNSVAQLCEAFTQTHQGNFIVMSDHGMVNIRERPKFQPEKALGVAGESSYLYFTDSTMARFWMFKAGLQPKVETYLESLGVGYILSESEREEYGVTSHSFGDLIFIFYEGVVPSPAYTGGKRTRAVALHGYDPYSATQKALFLSTISLTNEQGTEILAREVFKMLKSLTRRKLS